MTALPAIDPTTAQPEAAAALAQAKAAFGGTVPNPARVMADSPTTLRRYFAFSQALSDGRLGPDVSERIALLVAEQKGCAYCLSAHTHVAANAFSNHVAKAARVDIDFPPVTPRGSAA